MDNDFPPRCDPKSCDPPPPIRYKSRKALGSKIVINVFDDDPGGTGHGGADPSDVEDPVKPDPSQPNEPAEPPERPDPPEKPDPPEGGSEDLLSDNIVLNIFLRP